MKNILTINRGFEKEERLLLGDEVFVCKGFGSSGGEEVLVGAGASGTNFGGVAVTL